MILFPASKGFQVASFSVLTTGPNEKKGPENRPMKRSPKIRATRSSSTYNNTYVYVGSNTIVRAPFTALTAVSTSAIT